MRKRAMIILAVLCLMLSVCSCGSNGAASQEETTTAAMPEDRGLSSDIARSDEHEDITWDLITLVEHDAELKRLLEKSILQAAEENPDRDTNPVDSLGSYYKFRDRIVRAMPWEISPY